MKNHTLEIKITPEVMAYLKKKDKDQFTLDIRTSGGGCCPTIEVAEVIVKAPDNTALYNLYVQDGIHIYISKKARISVPVLKFILKKSFLMTDIQPIGLSLKKH